MANKVYNFSAGPSVLPEQALKEASAACIDFENSGISILSMSHRSKPIENMFAQTEQYLRELMGIPEDYDIVFLGGGCSLLFCMLPMNFLDQDATADYALTGVWANKAYKEAKQFGNALAACDTKSETYSRIDKNLKLSDNASYLHVTANNTIYGTEWHNFPKPKSGFLMADVSSDFLARKINVSDFGVVYGGAQKNISCAGVTVTIIKKGLLGKVNRTIPTMLNFQTHIDAANMFNTPPVFAVYVMNRTLKSSGIRRVRDEPHPQVAQGIRWRGRYRKGEPLQGRSPLQRPRQLQGVRRYRCQGRPLHHERSVRVQQGRGCR